MQHGDFSNQNVKRVPSRNRLVKVWHCVDYNIRLYLSPMLMSVLARSLFDLKFDEYSGQSAFALICWFISCFCGWLVSGDCNHQFYFNKLQARKAHPPPMLQRWRSRRQFCFSHLCLARRVGKMRVNNLSFMLNHSHGGTLKLTSSSCRWMTELRWRNQNARISRHFHVYRAKCFRGPDQQSFHITSGDLVQTNRKPGISLKVRPKTQTSELLLRTFWVMHDFLWSFMYKHAVMIDLMFPKICTPCIYMEMCKYRVSYDFITEKLQEILGVSVWNSSLRNVAHS